MRALVWHGPQNLQVENVPEPTITGDEIRLQPIAVGICGSELEGYLGKSSIRKPPLIMGHEFTGEVIEVGKRVQHLTVGEHVVVNPLIATESGNELIGAHHPGAFAEQIAVPAAQVISLDKDIDPYRAALAEPLATAIHAVHLAQIKPGMPVVVWGTGTIGALTAATAYLSGAHPVVGIDMNPSRLEAAFCMGATHTIAADHPQIIHEILTHIPPGQRVTVFETVGRAITRQSAVEVAQTGGQVVFVGLHDMETTLNINDVIRDEVRLSGSYAYSMPQMKLAVRLLGHPIFDNRGWLDVVSLQDAPAAFERLLHNPGGTLKVMVSPQRK